MHRGWIALGMGAVLAAASVPSGAQAGHTLQLPTDALVAPGQPPSLVLLYTGNVIGYLEPCG